MIRNELACGTLVAALLAAGPGAQAAPPTSSAADIPNTLTVGGQSLALNGSGTRYKAAFQVYEVGLYAGAPVRSVDDLATLAGPKLMRLVARRDLPTNELGRMLIQGLTESNPREELMRQLTGLAQVGGMFGSRQQIVAGESFGFQFVPGVGTILLINDRTVGEPVRDPAFDTLLMRIWLGHKPVDGELKARLPGLPAREPAAANRL